MIDKPTDQYNKEILSEILVRKLKDPLYTNNKNLSIETRAKLAAVDSISNFKTLRKIFGKGKTFDAYGLILNKMEKPDSPNPEVKKRTTNASLEKNVNELKKLGFVESENILLSKYKESVIQIKFKLKRIETLRSKNTENKEAIKQNQIKMHNELRLLKFQEMRLNKRNKQKSIMNSRSSSKVSSESDLNSDEESDTSGKHVGGLFIAKEKNLNLDDFMKLNEIKNKKNKITQQAHHITETLDEEVEKNNRDIEKLEKEVEELKVKKILFKYKLKEFYITVIKNVKEMM